MNCRILMCYHPLFLRKSQGGQEEREGGGEERRRRGAGGKGGTNRCARIHAVAARPHCRLTLTVPGDAARHGEFIFIVFCLRAHGSFVSVSLVFLR